MGKQKFEVIYNDKDINTQCVATFENTYDAKLFIDALGKEKTVEILYCREVEE